MRTPRSTAMIFGTRFPRFSQEARKANQAAVDLLNDIAGQKKGTPAQVALAWLLARKPPLPTRHGAARQFHH